MSKQRTIRTLTIGGAAAAALALGATTPAAAETAVPEPERFTSAFVVNATPDQVIGTDGATPAPGEDGATGTFEFRINSDLEIICYDITLTGVTGDYQSMAKTSTHIHEAAIGAGGPPRIAFPDPAPVDGDEALRTSSGCLQGPFTTGIVNDGVDTGDGFTLAQIEANPAGFTGDAHTANFVPGVVRGQLTAVDLPVEPEPAPEPVTPEPGTPAPQPESGEDDGADDGADGSDTLAETGVEPGQIAGLTLGGLAIAAGAGLLIARRRAQRA
jgi:hypothetical protein